MSDSPTDCRQTLLLASESATDALARCLGRALSGGQRIYLSGDLGAGKTRFVRGLLRGLGHTGRVRSPTFTLLEPYDLLSFRIYHFDFYRFSSQNEWRDAGFDEALSDSGGVCLIEWPEMAGATLPGPDLHITLQVAPDPDNKQDDEATTQRLAQLQAQGPWAQSWLSQLCQLLGNGPHEGISLRPA